MRRAIEYALSKGRKSVTLVHKGNIMKFTEGAFRDWGYQVGDDEFPDIVVREEKLSKEYEGKLPEGKVLINDRIADSMFQQVLTRPSEYSVLATPNLNGDYLSDAAAAQVEYAFRYSSNLLAWQSFVPEVVGVLPDLPGYERVENRVPAGIAIGQPVLFVLMESRAPML